MSSYTTILCYAIDSKLLSQLLNQTDSSALVAALRAAGKQTAGAKKKFEKRLAEHLPFLERIMEGIPAKDADPFGEDEEDDEEDGDWDDDDDDDSEEDDDDDDWDDDEPFESEQYINAFEWLCDRLGKPIPIPESLLANSVVAYDYYGFTEALRRFQPPFRLPMLDDAGLLVGFIPKEQLSNFQFKPIDPARAKEIQDALQQLELLADDPASFDDDPSESDSSDEAPGNELGGGETAGNEVDGGNVSGSDVSGEEDDEDEEEGDDFDFTSFLAERAKRDFAMPEAAEIELAHDELAAIFADIHLLDKDFIGIIRCID